MSSRRPATHAEVEVWFLDLTPDHLAEVQALGLLTVEERHRAGRVQHDEQRSAHIRTRAALRRVLAGFLDIDAHDVPIGAGPDGKPEIALPAGQRRPYFNVSHSGSIAIIAVSASRQVGVDVEQVRDLAWPEVADTFFSPAELGAIATCVPEDRRAAFFECWVRKEAYLKGLGTGLRAPTDDFHVPLDRAGGIVHDPNFARSGNATWYLHRLDARPGYVAALAVDDRNARLTIRGSLSPDG